MTSLEMKNRGPAPRAAGSPGRTPGALARIALLALALTGLAACGRDGASRTGAPALPGRVTLRLTRPAGTQEPLPPDTLLLSAFTGTQRLAGPVQVIATAGVYQASLDVPSGSERVIVLQANRDPNDATVAGAPPGYVDLGVSEPFPLAAGETREVSLSFRRFEGRALRAEAPVVRTVPFHWPAVTGATRYRLRYTQSPITRNLLAGVARDTVVTDTSVAWPIALAQLDRTTRHLVAVRPESPYGAGAFSEPVTVPVGTRPDITGRILSAGQPVPNVLVRLLTCPNNADSGVETFTDAAGRYAFAGVPEGSYRLRLFRGGCGDVYDPPLESTCFTFSGTAIDRPDYSFECTVVYALFTLTWDATPADLDAHLFTPAIPDTDNTSQAYEVYYGETGAIDSPPFAQLDVDNTRGFGPENVTIYRNFPGDYIFAVYNYSGEDSLGGSGATVRIVPPQGAVRTATAPTVGDFRKRWWIVARLNGSTGALTMIDSLATDPPAGFGAPAAHRPKSAYATQRGGSR